MYIITVRGRKCITDGHYFFAFVDSMPVVIDALKAVLDAYAEYCCDDSSTPFIDFFEQKGCLDKIRTALRSSTTLT